MRFRRFSKGFIRLAFTIVLTSLRLVVGLLSALLDGLEKAEEEILYATGLEHRQHTPTSIAEYIAEVKRRQLDGEPIGSGVPLDPDAPISGMQRETRSYADLV